MKRMYCSNWRFAVFLLIMSGFWTSFNQIFYTMPEYIRDFTETRPMIELRQKVSSARAIPRIRPSDRRQLAWPRSTSPNERGDRDSSSVEPLLVEADTRDEQRGTWRTRPRDCCSARCVSDAGRA